MFGVFSTYLSRPVVLRVPSPGPPGSRRNVVDNQVNATFLFGYGVTDRLQLDLALPITLGQDGTGLSPITAGSRLQDTAIRDLRFGLAYALVPRARVAPDAITAGAGQTFSVTARLAFSAPTGQGGQFAGERGGVAMPSVAADYRRGRWYAGTELGLRLRETTEFAGARVGTQLSYGLGVGYDLLKQRELLAVQAEARVLPTFASQGPGGGAITFPGGEPPSVLIPAEWMVSVRSAPVLNGDFALLAGGGGGIPFAGDASLTTPRFRFVLGFTYAPLARDRDGDGVPDNEDKCPDERGVRVSRAGAGCPKSAEPEGESVAP
jgi:hypothetical protein